MTAFAGLAQVEGIAAQSSAEYRVDLMAENVRGVPFIARTGADDQVISPYLSRVCVYVWCVCGCRSLARVVIVEPIGVPALVVGVFVYAPRLDQRPALICLHTCVHVHACQDGHRLSATLSLAGTLAASRTDPYLCAWAVCADEEMHASSLQAWSLGRSQCRERRREGGAGGKHLHVGAAGISLQSLVCARHSPQVLVLHHTMWIIRCRYRQRLFGYACVPTATS